MSIEIRGISGDEVAALDLPISRGFLDVRVEEHPDPEPDHSRSFAAVVDGEMVGGCSSYDFEMNVPGGGRVEVGGLTSVAVQATHQRLGAMSGLVGAHLADCRERGEAASVLMAAQATIYGRFGYGWASDTVGWRVDRSRSQFRERPDTGGSLRFILQDDAAATLAAIYPGAMAARAGSLSRPGSWFEAILDRKESWMGGGDLFVVVHRGSAGVDDGYVLYRITPSSHDAADPVTATIVELVASDPVVEAALWQFCLEIDPVGRVEYLWGPVDPAVARWLADRRALETTRRQDFLWLRPLDVAGLMGSRSYRVDGRLVIGIDDPADPAVHGSWELEVEAGTAEARRSGDDPQISMTAAGLGEICLGGSSAEAMWRAGTLAGDREAVASADVLLGTARPPWCITKF